MTGVSRLVEALQGPAGVALVAVLGTAMALQGWKSRPPNFDLITSIDAAEQFLATGRLPDRGVLTSFFSFAPPGAAWLLVPGVLLFDEPALFEVVGTVGTYVATLIGIFLLTRMYFGPACAILAVVLYGFSEVGLSAASSLWQRYPTHCFFVWMVYCLARWADENRPWFLAGAIVTLATGMYVFLEIAPAILLVPVLWFARRPTVRLVPIAMAVSLSLLLWYPYLEFQRGRAFVDVASQVRRQLMDHGDLGASWCDPAAFPESWRRDVASARRFDAAAAEAPAPVAARRWMSDRVVLILNDLLFANFGASRLRGERVVLFTLTVAGLLAAAATTRKVAVLKTDAVVWRRRLATIAAAGALLGVAVNEIAVARFVAPDGALGESSLAMVRTTQAVLLAAAAMLMVGRNILADALARLALKWRGSATRRPAVTLALAVAVPWVVLLLLADHERRFWWLWPLQVVVLAAAVTYVPTRLGASRWVVRVGSFATALIVVFNITLLNRATDWWHEGWAGTDAIETQVADRLASQMKARGEQQAAIGYEIEIWRFMAASNVVDRRYKAGADVDMLLRYRHGIANLNTCAEGVSPGDSYRVVQTAPVSLIPLARNRVNGARPAGFREVDRVGVYDILRRD